MGSILLSAAEQRILRRAVSILERESFVAKLTELTGEPVTRIMKCCRARQATGSIRQYNRR